MNYTTHKAMTRNAVKSSFRGQKIKQSKVTPLYPESLEREYQRITNSYMKVLNDTLKEYLPELQQIAKEEEIEKYRTDGLSDLISKVVDVFAHIGLKFAERISFFGLQERVEKMSQATQKLSIKQWKKEVHSTLGIDIMEDYYTGDFYKSQTEKWVETNVNLITSIPQTSLGKMQEIVLEGYKNGTPQKKVVQEIQSSYNVDKKKARFIARDQLAKLNGDITRHQQMDAGVSKYRWSTSKDSRVRDDHKDLEGKVFSWDDPPIVDKRTGRRAHPMEDYNCRCVAIPIFEIDTLDLPFVENRKEIA